MAQARYIEKHPEDNWKGVSALFAAWLQEKNLSGDFGWSEGDTLASEEGLEFYCLLFPEKHGEKIKLFEHWAETTSRLYGVQIGQEIKFPQKPELNFIVPSRPLVNVPPWLK